MNNNYWEDYYRPTKEGDLRRKKRQAHEEVLEKLQDATNVLRQHHSTEALAEVYKAQEAVLKVVNSL